jgi:hypothetical protein
MGLIPVLCPHDHSDQVIKGGKTKAEPQRYQCQNPDGPHYRFQLALLYQGRAPTLKEQRVDHQMGKGLAYGCGRRRDQRFLQFKGLLEPFGSRRYTTDYWGAYTQPLDPTEHHPGT